MTDWTSLYLSKLPVRCEWGMGTCTDCSVLYAMELRGLILGQPVVQLSQLFSAYNQHETGGGGSIGAAVYAAKNIGVCAEYLWPITMIGLDWGLNDSAIAHAVFGMQPSDAAKYDAGFHRITDSGGISGWSAAKSALDAGYPVIAEEIGRDHVLCVMGYDDNIGCGLGFDERSTSSSPFRLSYSALAPWTVVRGVSFQSPPTYALTDDQVTSMSTWRSRMGLNTATSPLTVSLSESMAGELEVMGTAIGPIVPSAQIVPQTAPNVVPGTRTG